MKLRILRAPLLILVLACSSRTGFSQQRSAGDEVPIEAAIVEVDVLPLTVARIASYDDRVEQATPFAVVMTEDIARPLSRESGAKILQSPTVRATAGQRTTIRFGSRVSPPDSQQELDAGIDLEITPNFGAKGGLTADVTLQLRILSTQQREVLYAGPQIHQEVRLNSGSATILGGILTRNDAAALTAIAGMKSVPLLASLFPRQSDVSPREIILMLTPRLTPVPSVTRSEPEAAVTRANLLPDLPAPPPSAPVVVAPNPPPPASALAPVAPPPPLVVNPPVTPPPPSAVSVPVAPSPATAAKSSAAPQFTVQAGSFSSLSGAEALKLKLDKTYKDVFIDTQTAPRPLYRVRLGHFADRSTARKLESQLRAAGIKATVYSLAN